MITLRDFLCLLLLGAALLASPVLAATEGASTPDQARLERLQKDVAAHYAKKRFREALPLANQALALSEKIYGRFHAKTAVSVEHLADLQRRLRRFAEAEPQYLRAIELYERALGKDDQKVATLLNNLALVYRDQRRYAEAEPLLKRAIGIYEQALGPGHRYVATVLDNLGTIYFYQRRHDEAEPAHRQALEIYQKTLGPDHLVVGGSLERLARLYRQQKRPSEAQRHYLRALEICRQRLGPAHHNTATVLHDLALVYRDDQRFDQAEPLFRQAIAIYETALGPGHRYVATGLDNLADQLRRQNRPAEAEPLMRRALGIWQRTLGLQHRDLAPRLERLADLYASRHQVKLAEPLYRRTLAIRERTLGPSHPAVAATLVRYAALLRRAGRADQAEVLIKRATAITGSDSAGDDSKKPPRIPVATGLAIAGTSIVIGLVIFWLSRRRQARGLVGQTGLTQQPQQLAQPAPLTPLAYDRPRPWVRFWARMLDVADFSLFVALGLHLVTPVAVLPGLGERSFATGLVLLLAWTFFEAMLLATWGTTPGKWLLKIKIERPDGAALDYGSALKRSFAVWLRGLGCGLPLISLITLALAWNRLRENGQTSWDRDGGFVVSHGDIGLLRSLLAVLAFAGCAAVWLALDASLA